MQHSRPNLAFKPPIPRCPLHIFSVCTHSTAPCSWLFFFTPCFFFSPESLKVFQWNAGGLRASSTKLLHFILSHPVDFIYIHESNLNFFFSFRIPGFSALRSDCIHSWSGIFLLMPHTLAAASSFSSGRACPSLNFLPPPFLHLTLTLIM